MAGEAVTPGAERSITGGQNSGAFAANGFDIQRFGMEVANEIGVDPNNLGAYGLSAETIDQYETQLHSRNRNRSGSRR